MHFRRRNERGAEAVEFALIAIPFLILVLGIIQYGYYFWTAETTNSAARETARRVVVGDCWDYTAMKNFAVKNAPVAKAADVTRNPADMTGITQGTTVTVTVVTHANLLGIIPLPDGGTITREYTAIQESTKNNNSCPS
jgi:Flp pilus assembly protein TadG